MKRIYFFFALMAASLFSAQAEKQVYTSYNSSSKTLTYYYDESFNTSSRPNSEKYDPTSTTPRWVNYYEDVTSIVIDESMKDAPLTSMYRMFYGRSSSSVSYILSKVTSIVGLEHINTKNVTNMHSMFVGLESLKSLNLSSFNTANVEDMGEMFSMCKSLTSLDLSSFNTAKVTSMAYMFYECRLLTSLDLTSFNTAKVTNMACMFSSCTSLKSINLSSFNTEKVTNMAYMFKNCTALTSLDISKFRFTALTSTKEMFNVCSNLTTIYCNTYLSERDMLTQSTDMFTGCTKLKGGNNTAFNSSKTNKEYACPDKSNTPGYFTTKKCIYAEMTTNGTIMYIRYDEDTQYANLEWNADGIGAANMSTETKEKIKEVIFKSSMANIRPKTCRQWFHGLKNLTTISGISYLNTTECTSMRAMFSQCNALESLDVTGFNTTHVTNMSAMFYGCQKLTELDLRKFNTDKLEVASSMFYNCSALKTIHCDGNWNKSTLTNSSNMFYGCTNLVGGKGTAYNSSYLDKSYARPDEGTAQKGYFTGVPTGIEEVMENQLANSAAQKVMIDGQIYILRDGKAYNAQGAEVK